MDIIQGAFELHLTIHVILGISIGNDWMAGQYPMHI